MKKTVAVALVLMLLLTSAAACAESAGALSLSKLSISSVSGRRSSTVKLRKMSLSMLLGSVEGIPTLEINFDNGKGQQVDAIMQIVGTRLLVSIGGVSGTYYVDLTSIASEPGKGEMVAKAVGSALALAGPHLDVLLYALTTEDSKGVRSMEIKIPDALYKAMVENLLGADLFGMMMEDADAAAALAQRIAGDSSA